MLSQKEEIVSDPIMDLMQNYSAAETMCRNSFCDIQCVGAIIGALFVSNSYIDKAYSFVTFPIYHWPNNFEILWAV